MEESGKEERVSKKEKNSTSTSKSKKIKNKKQKTKKLLTLDSTDCDAASTSTNPLDLYPPTLTLYACARCLFSDAELNCVRV